MGELSVRTVDLAPPRLEREDLLDLCGHQPVHRVTAARPIGEQAHAPAPCPTPRPTLVEVKHAAGPLMRPALPDGVVDQVEQGGLVAGREAGRDRAYQPERPFPRNATSSIACSLTVSSNRAISDRAA